ncbi:MAG: hypothetical protein ACI8P0_006287 [Planctomycetaceae bacterium]|jgi:hypothetical protein
MAALKANVSGFQTGSLRLEQWNRFTVAACCDAGGSISTSTRRTFSIRLTKELHGWSTPACRFLAPKFYRTMVRDDTHSPWTESRRLLTL